MDKLSRLDIEFIYESNKIEGITAPYTKGQEKAFIKFMNLEVVTLNDLKDFVKAYQPDAKLRNKEGMDVKVGGYYPPPGSKLVVNELNILLDNLDDYSPYENHNKYESLHPFTDCNGRSGRILWLWQMRNELMNSASLGFLHTFYYQSLNGAR